MWKKIKQRWMAETPRVWKFVRNFSASVGAISTAILTAETAAGVELPEIYRKLLALGIAIGAGVAAFSQMHQK